MTSVLMLLSILGLSLPFTHYFAGWLSLVGLVSFFLLLQRLQQKQYVAKEQFLTIWLIGLASFLIVLSWCLQTAPEKWAFISGWQANLALILVYLVFALIFSLQYVLFGLLWLKLKPNLYKKTIFLILPALWVVSEAARSLIFSLISFGPGGSIGINWNFGVLGIAASVTPLGYLARIVGMFGLSFVVVIINLCVLWVAQKRYKLPLLILLSIVVATTLSWLAWRPSTNQDQLKVGFVQLPQSFDGFTSGDGYYQPILDTAKGSSPVDVLVLPEYSEFFNDDSRTSIAQSTAHKLVLPDGVLVTSISGAEANNHDNRLVIYNTDGQVLTSQDKTFLIPIGEYLPYAIIGVFKLSGQNQLLHLHQETRIIAQGHEQEKALVSRVVQLGSLACSGAIAPELYRNLALGGAQLLTNSASLGIFTGAPLYHAQSRQFARFLAVANARPYVQAAAGAYSYIIDSDGQYRVKTQDFKTGYGYAEVGLVSSRTVYTLLGEWTVAASLVIVGIFAGLRWQNRLDTKKKKKTR